MHNQKEIIQNKFFKYGKASYTDSEQSTTAPIYWA
jgi:hypothetical protein